MSTAQVVVSSYQQTLFTFTWYSVEFVCYICIIAYVLAYFGIINPPKPKGNVVETANQTWAQTGEFVANAAAIARKFNQVLDPKTQAPAENK